MVDTGSPYRHHQTFGGGGARRNPADDNNNASNLMQDYKEKRKLLIRWNHYFPHENVKEFDVRKY
jgi:hypothetical protein